MFGSIETHMTILSDSMLVKFVESTNTLDILTIHNDEKNPIHISKEAGYSIRISKETRSSMSLEEFSKFLGERIILLSPSLRKEFEDYLWSSDGVPPKRK